MATENSTTETRVAEALSTFAASNMGGFLADMVVNIDRRKAITDDQRAILRKHADHAVESIPSMIRGVAQALFIGLSEGNLDRVSAANCAWCIDMLADTLNSMQLLADDLATPAGGV